MKTATKTNPTLEGIQNLIIEDLADHIDIDELPTVSATYVENGRILCEVVFDHSDEVVKFLFPHDIMREWDYGCQSKVISRLLEAHAACNKVTQIVL